MSAGLSFRTSGARPMLQASATSAAQTLVARLGIRERLSLTCGNASAKPVHVFTSRSSSGRSTRGSLRSVTSRSSSRLGGSSSPPQAGENEFVLFPGSLDPYSFVLRPPIRRPSVRIVEFLSDAREERFGARGQPQHPARTSTGFVPSGRRYELRPWIAPLCTLCDEDIAPAQCAAKVFEDAAGERAALHLTGFDEYRRFPGRRH